MTAGPVNRPLLESFFQNPGDIYDDSKTEACLDVLADQIDENWTPLSNVIGPNGSTFVGSPAIVGVIGTLVYDQLVSLKTQIDAIVGGSIPPGTVTYDKLAPTPTATPTANNLPLWDTGGVIKTNTPVSGTDAANKTYADQGNTYYNLSDTVIVSLPTERSGSGFLKSLYIKNGGRYRIKGEFRSSTSGDLLFSYTIGNSVATTFAKGIISTSSPVYATFSFDTPYLPENATINLSVNGGNLFVRNVTLCGDPVIGNPNSFGGVD